MSQSFGIHWFRRDLRLRGNLNLLQNLKRHEGRVLGIFFFDSEFLARKDFSHNRFAFFIETLAALQGELKSLGGDLLVIDERAQKALPVILRYFAKNHVLPTEISAGRDYEPYAIQRDTEVQKILESFGVRFATGRDHLLFEPPEVVKENGDYYKVYTPFSRQWLRRLQSTEGVARIEASFKKTGQFSINWKKFKKFPFTDSLVRIKHLNSKNISVQIPPAGHGAAVKQLNKFVKKLPEYSNLRNFPAIEGTSGLSLYLKNGSLTPAQIINRLQLAKKPDQFLKELIWREFYYSVLFHKPAVQHSPFQEKYIHLKWENNKKNFKRWCDGQTGFPIVDAGMRQLNTTGWMHNRVRMIVASFLTKDLLIDWRLGENYFMQKLLDGDLAANNGGWQWAASTGCDPQPYFRIFNPWLQSAKFDPDGVYIKKYVPELKKVAAACLHIPNANRGMYPEPILNHSLQSRKAKALFKKIAG